MSRNIREKIFAIVNDTYDIRREDTVSAIERLIKDELELRDQEREVTYYDMVQIQSLAVKEYSNLRMNEDTLGKMSGDQGLIRTLCVFNATVAFLRSKKLLYSLFRYKK